MDKTTVFRFLNENPVFHLASVHMGKPHVRALLLFRADEQGIVFHTSKSKDLFKQLSANPNVELCFNNLEEDIQIRVSGVVEFIDDASLKQEILEKREKLQTWLLQQERDMLSVMILKHGLASIWMPEITFLPKRYILL